MALLLSRGHRGLVAGARSNRRLFTTATDDGSALARMGYVAPSDLSTLCTGELPRRDEMSMRAQKVLPGLFGLGPSAPPSVSSASCCCVVVGKTVILEQSPQSLREL